VSWTLQLVGQIPPKIDRNFVNKISIISVPKQRELVDMLFWWEEELTRWRLLDEEQAEIEGLMSAASEGSQHDEAELQERMRVIEAKRRVLPSLRRSDGSLKVTEERPPEYAAESSPRVGWLRAQLSVCPASLPYPWVIDEVIFESGGTEGALGMLTGSSNHRS
jgi:hypothetical protein